MVWDVKKAQERFRLAHAKLGDSQAKLEKFLEQQLDAVGLIKSYGTSSNPSQQLKNKLGQATTIPGGMLTLSIESRAVHDRAVETFVDEWGKNKGWAKAVACVALVYPTDTGWKIGTIVEWTPSKFPDAVKAHLFPDATVVPAKGGPAAAGRYEHRTYEVDDRYDDPNDSKHREAEFRKGWKAALDPTKAPYKDDTLKKLTWHNLGYRLGAIYGETSQELIGVAYDWAVRQQSSK